MKSVLELEGICLSHNTSFIDGYHEGICQESSMQEYPLVETWPLMGSPVPVLMITTTYILMAIVGSQVMKNRPSFNLDNVMILYNAFQILVMVTQAYKAIGNDNIFKNGFLLGGCDYPVYTRDLYILNGCWVYLISKLIALQDTVFYILMKKSYQALFVQVYHRTFMVISTWYYLKYAAGGDGAVLVFLNCCTHVFVHLYNLLKVLRPKFQKYFFLKQCIIVLQLMQYILSLLYIAYAFFSPKCSFSNSFNAVLSFNIGIFIVLLLSFHTEEPDLYFRLCLAFCYVLVLIDSMYQRMKR